MPSLKEIKERISSVKSTQQITKAMKMVAASKLRRAQDKITQMRPYSQKLNQILVNVSSSTEIESPFLQEREVKRVLVVLVTSDRGLCGGFNMNAIKETEQVIKVRYAAQHAAGNVDLLCIGNKGYAYFKRRNYSIISDYVDTFHHLSFEAVKRVADFALMKFEAGEYDRVDIVYNEFKNVITQVLHADQWLPLRQHKGHHAHQHEQKAETQIIFEPSKEVIAAELVPKVLKLQLYTAVLDSNAAEQGARMGAMDKATENAGDLIKQLTLTYNRTRQAAITREIIEIVSGAEALAGA